MRFLRPRISFAPARVPLCVSASLSPLLSVLCHIPNNNGPVRYLPLRRYRLCPAGSTLDEECFSKTPLSLARSSDGTYKHLVIMGSDPSKDYEIPATVVEEGGGIGWVVHPMGAADPHPCDWNPAATGKHCDYVSCLKCGAPWYAADGACPCSCGVEQSGGISGGHL